MGFFDWNKDAERRVIEFTNNFTTEITLMDYQSPSRTNSLYLEVREKENKNKKTRFTVYDREELKTAIEYLSEKFGKQLILTEKKYRNRTKEFVQEQNKKLTKSEGL